MIIRKARPNDSQYIAKYLLLAMEDIIYEFIGEKNHQKALEFLMYFTQKENHHPKK